MNFLAVSRWHLSWTNSTGNGEGEGRCSVSFRKLWSSEPKQRGSSPEGSQLRCPLSRKILVWLHRALVRPGLGRAIRTKGSVLKGVTARWNRWGEEPSGWRREPRARCSAGLAQPCGRKAGRGRDQVLWVPCAWEGEGGGLLDLADGAGRKPNGYRLPINTLGDQITLEDGG